MLASRRTGVGVSRGHAPAELVVLRQGDFTVDDEELAIALAAAAAGLRGSAGIALRGRLAQVS